MPRFTLIVNGARREVEDDGRTPLLWILRDRLGLTGTKYGCGEGVCGACTVLEGHDAVRSCRLALSDASGRAYTTIEGLSADGSHPLQRVWLDQNVSQCGYCQPGMILELAALFDKNPRPSPQQVDEVLAEHVCRCGSYPRIRHAVLAVSQSEPR